MRKRWLGALLSAVMAVSLAACSSTGAAPAASGSTAAAPVEVTQNVIGTEQEAEAVKAEAGDKNLVYSINRDITNLGPFGNRSATMQYILPMLYNSLYCAPFYGASADQLEPEMAESYEILDGNILQVKLRDYVHDSQGNPIKAEDVKASFEGFDASGIGASVSATYKEIQVVDDYTVNFVLNGDDVGNIEVLLTGCPIVNGEWLNNSSEEEIGFHPATSGPYTLVEAVPGSHVILAKNENYWQTNPELLTHNGQQPFDTVRFNIVLESAMGIIGLQNGEVDIKREIPVMQLSDFASDDWELYSNLNGMNYFLVFNGASPVVGENKELRQAIAYATDAEALLTAFAGNSPVAKAGGVLKTYGSPAFGDYLEKWDNEDYYEYDLDKAKELMAQAGYPDGGVKVVISSDATEAKKAALEVLVTELADIGVECELKPELSVGPTLADPTAWDILFLQNTSYAPFNTAYWKYNFNPEAWGPDRNSYNYVYDEELLRLLDEACSTETNSEETMDAFHQYLKEQCHSYGLFYTYEYFVSTKGLHAGTDGNGNVSPVRFSYDPDWVSVADK